MVSLTVDEREAGYLGVASGAAMLRLLEPNKESARRWSISRARWKPDASTLNFNHLTAQPSPNRHIAEHMIDAYFRVGCTTSAPPSSMNRLFAHSTTR